MTDDRVAQELPPFDRPTLYAETARVPTHYGFATPGSGGALPGMVALEPPLLGNPSWTLGVQNGLGGAASLLLFDWTSAPAGGIPFHGAHLFVGLTPGLIGLPLFGLAGSGPGQGVGSIPVGIPDWQSLSGTSLYLQWLFLDPGAPQGVGASDAVAATLF